MRRSYRYGREEESRPACVVLSGAAARVEETLRVLRPAGVRR